MADEAVAATATPTGADANASVSAAPDFESAVQASAANAAKALEAKPEAAEAEEAAPAAVEEAPSSEEAAAGEEGVTPPPSPEADQEFEGQEIKPDKVSEDGKTLWFSKKKATSLMQARDQMDKIRAEIPNASLDTLKQHYEESVLLKQMLADVESGAPERVAKFVDFWLGREAPMHAVHAFTREFAQALPKSSPEAARMLHRYYVGNTLNALYREAQKTGDDQTLLLAQNLEYKLTGRFRESNGQQTNGAPDPLAEDRARLDYDRRQFEQARRQEAEQRMNAFMANLDASVRNVIIQEIDAAIPKEMKETFKGKPQLKHMARDWGDLIEEARASNPTWSRQFQIAQLQARNNPSEQTRKVVEDMMRQFAKSVIWRNRKNVLDSVTGQFLNANAAAHAAAKQAVARTEPMGSQSPAQRQTHQQKLLNSKSYEEAFGHTRSRFVTS